MNELWSIVEDEQVYLFRLVNPPVGASATRLTAGDALSMPIEENG
jgi:hypothetical protein